MVFFPPPDTRMYISSLVGCAMLCVCAVEGKGNGIGFYFLSFRGCVIKEIVRDECGEIHICIST